MDAIFAVGEALRGARVDADRLRLVGRQRDLARGVEDHRLGGAFARVGGGDGFERAVGLHPLELDRDAVGRDVVADIVEDDLGPAAPVEDDPRRRDQQVADPGVERGRDERERGGGEGGQR